VRSRLLSLAISTAVGSTALLQAQVPAAPPKSRVEIPYQRFMLPNGLTLIVHQDHKAPIVAVNVWYHVGSKNERPGRTGFAHLFEHLMFNGTENYDKDFFGPMEQASAHFSPTSEERGADVIERCTHARSESKTAPGWREGRRRRSVGSRLHFTARPDPHLPLSRRGFATARISDDSFKW